MQAFASTSQHLDLQGFQNGAMDSTALPPSWLRRSESSMFHGRFTYGDSRALQIYS